jgi:hypothetical protein
VREPTLLNPAMTGARFDPLGATNVNPLVRLDVLPPEVTATSAAPGVVRALVNAVSDVVPDTTTLVAATPPMTTVASAAKPVPLMVTVLPPVVLPDDGETAETFRPVDVGLDGESPQATTTSESAAAMKAAKQVLITEQKP